MRTVMDFTNDRSSHIHLTTSPTAGTTPPAGQPAVPNEHLFPLKPNSQPVGVGFLCGWTNARIRLWPAAMLPKFTAYIFFTS